MANSPSLQKSTNGRALSFSPGLKRARRIARAAGSLSPRLGARVAKRMWSTPRSFPAPDRERPYIASARRVRMPLGVRALTGWAWGEGPTVLLVHGWEGRASQLGAFAGPLVDRGFRVVAFDAPGHGDSGGGESSLFSFADAVVAAARSVGPLHGIVAHSMGCPATMLALSGGLPVPRVVFVSPADAALAPPRFASTLGLSPSVQRHLFAALEDQYGATFDDVSLSRLAPRMKAELLVIHDADDRFAPLSDAERLVAARPGATLRVTRDLGHHRIVRAPTVVTSAVAFIDAPSDVRDGWHSTHDRSPQAVTTASRRSFGLTVDDLEHDLTYGWR